MTRFSLIQYWLGGIIKGLTMQLIAAAALCAVCVFASSAIAEQRDTIGVGRLFSNDYLGDRHDRWRTGSYVVSQLRGPLAYDGQPQPFGDIIEYRLRGEIIAPQTGNNNVGARPYVGTLSLGLHTHFDLGGSQASLGADLTAIGPQTRLDQFQESIHEALSLPLPSRNNQLQDDVFISGTAAVSHRFDLGGDVTWRPFAEAQVGVEDLVRVGGDLMIGQAGQDALMLRDVVTGQLYDGTSSSVNGLSYVVGADIAAVADSVFLPEEGGYVASDTRTRARAGVRYQFSEDITMFYGMTYLSEEFEGQPEGQVVGSLKLNFNF